MKLNPYSDLQIAYSSNIMSTSITTKDVKSLAAKKYRTIDFTRKYRMNDYIHRILENLRTHSLSMHQEGQIHQDLLDLDYTRIDSWDTYKQIYQYLLDTLDMEEPGDVSNQIEIEEYLNKQNKDADLQLCYEHFMNDLIDEDDWIDSV